MKESAPPNLRDVLAKPESIREHLERRKRLCAWFGLIGLALIPSSYILMWSGYPFLLWPTLTGVVLGGIGGIGMSASMRCPRCGSHLDWWVVSGEGGNMWFRLPEGIGCWRCGASFDDAYDH